FSTTSSSRLAGALDRSGATFECGIYRRLNPCRNRFDKVMKLIAVIPAYNEATHVGPVIESVWEYVDDIVVVDDGSTDGTFDEARKSGARVFRHVVNRGLGGSIATG